MNLHFSTAGLGNALLLMLLGMVGIFAVMLVILLTVKLLNRFAKDKEEPQNG